MKPAFTLIELLIVIAIIGVLMTMMLPNFLNAQNKAREVAVKSVVFAFQTALESYNIDQGTYPAGSDQPISSLYQTLSTGGYMSKAPVNPFTGNNYQDGDSSGKIIYNFDSTNGKYTISAYKNDGQTIFYTISN